MPLDSNIIIYAGQPAHADLRRSLAAHPPVVSAASYVEVLGYHKLTETERLALEEFFACATILPITRDVVDAAVALRQSRKMTLGDALVAATALVHNLDLVTRNAKDFAWIVGLRVHNPFPN
ncbi:MAG: PIN domain nuclease [Isosphaera sp.]|nr:PIN domain nuclease [Isosphaera sp.]